MTMCSGAGSRPSSASIAGTKSSATVQQMHPFASSIRPSSSQPGTPQPRSSLAVDAEFAELVDDQRDPPRAGMAEQVAQQRRLAGTEEAGDDRGGHLAGNRHDGASAGGSRPITMSRSVAGRRDGSTVPEAEAM